MSQSIVLIHGLGRTGRDSLPNQLPILEQHRVGLIAGTRSVEFWFYPLFHQVNDGKVGINNVTLRAAHPAIQIHATHTFIMSHADTQKQTLHFLQNGDFLSVTSSIDAPHTKTVKIQIKNLQFNLTLL